MFLRRMRRTVVPLLCAAAALVGCPSGDSGIGNVLVVANVEVAPGNSDLTVGTTRQLSATPKTSSGIDRKSTRLNSSHNA